MLRLTLTLLVTGWIWASGTSPSVAQSLCGDRGEIIEHLEKTYAEKRQALGLSRDGGLLEVLVSPNGGWTILISYPNRPTCVVATGDNWEGQVVAFGHAV